MPREILILSETELREIAPLDLAAVDVVENAFRALAAGGVVMPPVLSMAIAERHGEVDVKTAYLPGIPHIAVKISPGFFDNPRLGLPSLNGLMVALSAETGLVEAVLLDNGWLTDLRTAAAGAVAARALAPAEVTTAGVLGSGAQARLQLRALNLVRPFRRAFVWGRDPAKAAACAADVAAATGALVEAAASAEEVVRASEFVVTTTPATAPVLDAAALHPGLHITAMGADQGDKNELAPAVIAAADLLVCDRVAQCAVLGELRSARAAGLWADRDPPELGEVLAGRHAGRSNPEAVTICDLTGTGAQDTAIAAFALARARAAGVGHRFVA